METPQKRGPNVPLGCVLVNEKWRGSRFEKSLSGVCRGMYIDNMGVVDFYPSEACPVVYISEGELLSGTSHERKLQIIHKVNGAVIVADRNTHTIKQFADLQDRCFSLDLSLIPIGNISELPQVLSQLAYMETKSPSNPFKRREKRPEDLPEKQFKIFSLIPGVGDKKARLLLDHFGNPNALARIPEEMLVSKLLPLIGEFSAKSVYNFYYKRNHIPSTT